jgi:hypothetical protein
VAYRELMHKLNALPVHTTVAEIHQSVARHLREHVPLPVRGKVIVLVGEMHGTVASMAQAMAVFDYFKDQPAKLYMKEAEPSRAARQDAVLAEVALTLCAGMADPPDAIDAQEFADRISGQMDLDVDLYQDVERRGHLMTDTCAKLAGFPTAGFDPHHDGPSDEPTREAAMNDTIDLEAVADGVTVVRGGAFHASAWLDAFSGRDDVTVAGIFQVSDPPDADEQAIGRLDALLSHPHSLSLLGTDAIQNQQVDMLPLLRHASSDPARIYRLTDDMGLPRDALPGDPAGGSPGSSRSS